MDMIAWIIRILWACRISVLSAVAGLALFGLTIPAQNLFADLSFHDSFWTEIPFWAGVFIATFLMWAFPIHYGARLTLQDGSWIVSRAVAHKLGRDCRQDLVRRLTRDYGWLVTQAPRVLGLIPFVAIALGIYLGARADEAALVLPEGKATIAQAWWLAGADGVTAILFYVFVTLRRPFINRYLSSDRSQTLLVRFAGISALVTTGYFGVAYFFPIFLSFWCPRALLVPPLFGSLVLGLSWLQIKAHRTGYPLILILVVAITGITALNAGFHDVRTLKREVPDEGRLTMETAIEAWKAANGCSTSTSTSICPRPVVVAIDGGASRSAFTAATFIGELFDRMNKTIQPIPGEATTPGRRFFAISGVSGGAYGAGVIQAALAESQTAGDGVHPPCRSAHRTWFGYGKNGRDLRTSWLDCLQALTSGDYLSPTIVGLAFRDAIAPRLWLIGGPSLIEDRAALLEQSWERHFSYTLTPDATLFTMGSACGSKDGDGLCRPIAHPGAFLKTKPPGTAWLPLLLLNGTSVETGRRIVSADLKSVKAADKKPGTLYGQAYDLGEAMSSPCPPQPDGHGSGSLSAEVKARNEAKAPKVKAGQQTTPRFEDTDVCDEAVRLNGPDVRLSTAALASARFPVISPAGALRMSKSEDPVPSKAGTVYGDHVVDGGYFENSGLTTALEVVGALRNAGLNPILLSISNDPRSDEITGKLPRRPALTPLVPSSENTFWFRTFSIVEAPLLALIATRDGHAAEAQGRAAALYPGNLGFPQLSVKSVLDPTPSSDIPLCQALLRASMPPEKSILSMTKVSMSWWLSAAVQADLDAQRCDVGNAAALTSTVDSLKRP